MTTAQGSFPAVFGVIQVRAQPPNERTYAIARQLCIADHETNLRLHALGQLANLETHTTLSLKAILSCALDPSSRLNVAATEVIQRLVKAGQSAAILAVAYRMAKRSDRLYRLVSSELLHSRQVNLAVHLGEMRLLPWVHERSWSQIREFLNIEYLEAMPKDPATLRRCRVVMENPHVDDIPGLLQELLEDLRSLKEVQLVRRVLVHTAVHWRDSSLSELVVTRCSELAGEIRSVVLRDTPPPTELHGLKIVATGDDKARATNMVALVDAHVANLRDGCEEDDRQKAALKMVDAACRRVLPVRSRMWQLCELAGQPEAAANAVKLWVDEEVAAAKARAAAGDVWDKTQSFPELLQNVLGDVAAATYTYLPPELKTPVLVHVLTVLGEQFLQQHLQRFEPELGWDFESLDEVPHALAAVRYVVQAGNMSADDVHRYASDAEIEGPYEYRREDLQTWLLHHDARGEFSHDMHDISGLVARFDVEKLGCLLVPWYAYHGKEGYELCHEDIAVPGVLDVLLNRRVEVADDGQEVVTYGWHGAAWSYPQWYAFMFAQVHLAEEIVHSALAFLGEYARDHRSGYAQVLASFVAACEEHEEFRMELLKHVTEATGYGERSRIARQVLAVSGHVDWLADADRERVRELFRTQPEKFKYETATARALFTDEELRGIFAAAPNRWSWSGQVDAWTAVFLENPKHLVHLVQSPALKYGDSSEMESWLKWVKALGFTQDLGVLASLERYAFALGEHPDYHLMQEVCELLGIKYQHFR